MNKNWKAICEIKDTHFMWAIALLDLATDFGQMVARRFPEYFTDEPQQGPIPLSVLRRNASKSREVSNKPEEFLVTCEALPKDWPVMWFGDDDTMKAYSQFDRIPEALSKADKVGEVYEWQGKKVVLVERGFVQGEEWFFVPAELIAVDR